MTKTEFNTTFKLLCANLERPLSSEQLINKRELFWIKFNQLDEKTFFNACMAWINKSKFMPSISQIREIIDRQEYIPLTPEERQDVKMRFSAEFQYKLQLRFRKIWQLSKRLTQLKHAPPNMW